MFEQKAKRRRCLAMAAEHKTAGRIAVKPMSKYWRAGQSESQGLERGFKIGSPFGTTMHRQACRLVDHKHEAITVKHPSLDFFRAQFGNFAQSVKTFVIGAKPLTHTACGGHWI